MSLTKAVHTRFWASMSERFGKRWFDEYGEKPSRSWCDLIDRFTQEDISGALTALKDRHESNRAYPPTHAEFEAMLFAAVKRNQKPNVDYMRGYWRSCIVNAVAAGMQARNFIKSFEEFEGFLIRHKHSLGQSMLRLLDEVCQMEYATGQRTIGMEEMIAKQAERIVQTFSMRPVLEVVPA